MSNLALARLVAERKAWRKDHPHAFFARPDKSNSGDGSFNMYRWQCGIPGKPGTIWEGGIFPLICEFSEEYPSRPPKCKFPAGFFSSKHLPLGNCVSKYSFRRRGLETINYAKTDLARRSGIVRYPKSQQSSTSRSLYSFCVKQARIRKESQSTSTNLSSTIITPKSQKGFCTLIHLFGDALHKTRLFLEVVVKVHPGVTKKENPRSRANSL